MKLPYRVKCVSHVLLISVYIVSHLYSSVSFGQNKVIPLPHKKKITATNTEPTTSLPTETKKSNTHQTDSDNVAENASNSNSNSNSNSQGESSEAKRLIIDSKKPIRLDYHANSWNKNPNASESYSLLFRDGKSGKLARIEVNETGPNTAQFVGYYTVSWEDNELTPEFYALPSGTTKNFEASKVEQMIKDGYLSRKPYFLRTEGGLQTISIYDSKDQAVSAFDKYRKTLNGKPIVDAAALEAQRRAQALLEAKRLADLAKLQELERIRLEQDEKKRKEELLRQQALLDAAEKARRQKLAQQLAQEALVLFQQNKLEEAESKFAKAVELDPANNSFYYQYGVTLYKNDKFQKSIVVLQNASGENVNENERDYFLALNFMKLKDYEKAHSNFTSIKSKKDKTLSAPAAFFAGVIDFQKEKYDDSKLNFEFVLDNSSDPKMDEQAENYIEQIANIKAFLAEKAKKFILTLNFGLNYDSNILSVSNSQADSYPTDLAGFRWTYGGSGEYRMLYTEKYEFSGILTASDMYSTNKSFAAETSFQNTDPLVLNLSLPFKYKGVLLSKPFQGAVTAAYETINMNADASGSREVIVNSTIAKTDATFIMSEDWFSQYSLEWRNDKSLLTTAEDDSPTANKITLGTTNTFFQDKKKTTAYIGEFSYAFTNAGGKNQRSTKMDLGLTYMMPWKWETVATFKLGYYLANYPDHTTGRKDTDYALTAGLRKPINEKLSAVFSANYTINDSTLDSSAYKKYSIATSLSWNTSF